MRCVKLMTQKRLKSSTYLKNLSLTWKMQGKWIAWKWRRPCWITYWQTEDNKVLGSYWNAGKQAACITCIPEEIRNLLTLLSCILKAKKTGWFIKMKVVKKTLKIKI